MAAAKEMAGPLKEFYILNYNMQRYAKIAIIYLIYHLFTLFSSKHFSEHADRSQLVLSYPHVQEMSVRTWIDVILPRDNYQHMAVYRSYDFMASEKYV